MSPKISRRQLRLESQVLAAAVAPKMGEFFDSWAVVGIRAGCGTVMPLLDAERPDLKALEDAIIATANDILERRRGPKA